MQELYDAILDRRSIRQFKKDTPIDKATLEKLLLAGMYAPSARNQQPWRFIVVSDRETLIRLHGDIPVWAMLDHAAAAIIVLADPGKITTPQRDYFMLDCSAATQNILLAAHALGLGSVWLGTHPNEVRAAHAREVLKVPPELLPFSTIALGYPDETPQRPKRWDDALVQWGI